MVSGDHNIKNGYLNFFFIIIIIAIRFKCQSLTYLTNKFKIMNDKMNNKCNLI